MDTRPVSNTLRRVSLAALLVFVTANASAQNYAAIPLGAVPGGLSSAASALNNSGQVVGYSILNDLAEDQHAFLYSNGTMSDLGTLPAGIYNGQSAAVAINNSGQVAGSSLTVSGLYHAFLYSSGTMIDLGTLPGGHYSNASALNNSGQVIGTAESASGYQHAFLYTGGTMIDLGTLPGGIASVPSGINDSGQVIGSSQAGNGFSGFLYSGGVLINLGNFLPTAITNSGQMVGNWVISGATHAALYSGGTVIDLGTLPGDTDSYAIAINNSGQIIGYSGTTPTGHAFLYSGGAMIDLGTLPGGASSHPVAINNSGQIVGYSETGTNPHAFLYSGGKMIDLGVLMGPGNSGAGGINDHGQIIAYSGTAYLLTPYAGKLLGQCNCSIPGQPARGDPITLSTGNLFEQATDYKTAGQNKLDFTRYYNSQANTAAVTSFATTLGVNWNSTYDRYLNIASANSITAERADGQQLTFLLNSGAWASDTDVDVSLSNSGATWTLTDHNDTIETYTTISATEAQLQTIKARNGYTQTLAYNGSQQLTSVTDSYGRTLNLTYGTNGLLQSVTTPDSTTVTYGFTAGGGGSVLTSATYSSSPATTITYQYQNASLPFALTGIVDEDGNPYARWTYDTASRTLTSQLGAGADLTTVAYNSDGSRTVTNALGVQDLYTFTSALQGTPKLTTILRSATSTTAAASEVFTYDANGYTASQTDWNGNQTTYVNDVHGNPTTINEAAGTSAARTTTIAYDSTWMHLPASITTPGLTTSFTYDGHGEQLTKTLTDTTTATVPYPTNGQVRSLTNTWSNALLASVQTPNGNTTQYGYDSSGALISMTDAVSHVTTITSHTAGGRPLTIVDPNSVTTTLTYDQRQRLTSSSVSGTSGIYLTTWAYDAAGQLITTTLPDSSFLTNTYDTAHRLIKVTDALGNYISYTLDVLGDRTQTSIYTSGGTLTWQDSGEFDALGRELVDAAGAGQTTTRTFDTDGNVLSVTDGLNHKTTNSYDALNRLTTSTDANSGVTTPSYDAHDRVVSVTDANSNTTSYIRNGFEDVIQQTSPDSGVSVFHYDADANLASKTDALGIVTNQTFDALDRPLTTTYPAHSAENVAYTYDQTGTGFSFGIGRLTSVTDAVGSLTRSYEERGNLISEMRVNGTTTLTTSYTYDGGSRIASMTYPDGTLVTNQYDAAGYLSTVKARPAGSSTTTTIATLSHLPFGPQSSVTYGNGIAETRGYDSSYRATNIVDALSGTNLQNVTYGYDLANNVKSITDAVNTANSQTLGYDMINRLTSAASATGGYGSFSWTYDKLGNRLTQVQVPTTTTYGYTAGTNRLASITTSTISARLRTAPTIRPRNGSGSTFWAHAPPKAGPTITPVQSSAPLRKLHGIFPSLLGWPTLLAGFAGIIGFRKRLRNNPLLMTLSLVALLTGSVTLLNGCVSGSNAISETSPVTRPVTHGIVHGGQPPIAGATIQLYAVGTTGDASAATSLLTTPVMTDASGNFTITSDYTCPSTITEVYLVATGGNPGLSTPTNNTAISMMAALGPCGLLSASTYIFVNEVSTIGSLAALYPYMSSYSTLGSGSSDASALFIAFTVVNEYTNTSTGTDPGPALPAGYYASSTEINTLGDIIASCINSAGGTAGDGSPCGNLFALATPPGGVAPTDTIGAILDILKNPANNVTGLFSLASAAAPFEPSLSVAPSSWALPISLITAATPTFSPAAGTYATAQTITISDTTPGIAIYYEINGGSPILYTGPFTVSYPETIQAAAVAGSNIVSAVATAVYTVGTLTVTSASVTTNANGNLTSIPPANSSANATFAYNNANRLASVTGSPMAASFVYDWAGQRYSKTDGGLPPAIYSYMPGGTLIAENDGGTVTDYIYADGRPIAVVQPAATPAANQVNYVIADQLGTPQIASNSSGAVVWSTTYQPFGSTGAVTASITQNLRFPGQYADTETGFNYNMNRDYMPNLGRYLEIDPIGLKAGGNPYLYVRANPEHFTDRWGLCPCMKNSSDATAEQQSEARGANLFGGLEITAGGVMLAVPGAEPFGILLILGGIGAKVQAIPVQPKEVAISTTSDVAAEVVMLSVEENIYSAAAKFVLSQLIEFCVSSDIFSPPPYEPLTGNLPPGGWDNLGWIF